MDMPLVVENAAATAACGHRRLPGLRLNKLSATTSARSSICSSPSSVAAAELESRVRSPNGPGGAPPLNNLESSYKIAALEEQSDLGLDMTPMSYSDSTSTSSSSLATPNRASSPETPAITTPAKSLKLDGMMSPTLAAISSLDVVTPAASAKGLSSLCPPHSSLSLSSSCSSSSSTSGSSEHSSYSATHGSKNPPSSLTSAEDAPQHGKKRGRAARSNADADAQAEPASPCPSPTPTPISSATSTSTPTPDSLRPLGPAHLEHDYHTAHKSLSHAVAIAAYELFGFSIPVRNAEVEARRPGKDAIPLLRLHPLVRRAAREVDRADAELEHALARGETFENTPVPEEWRWGSEYLRPHEWARLEPECVVKKKKEGGRESSSRSRSARGGGAGERETSESGLGLRTRAQKRKAACEADGREEDENGSCSSAQVSSTAASSTMPDMPSSSSLAETTSSTITPTPEKRKRGRPRKHPLKAPSTASQPQLQIHLSIDTTAVTAPGPFTCVTRADPDPAALTPVKRKPGRPRKSDLPPALPSSSIPPNTAALGHDLRPAKRRRVTPSQA